MTESRATIDLASLFEEAMDAVAAHQREINALDGYNGNHGDNMVENVNTITSTLRAHREEPPSKALEVAGQKLAEKGAGGTSQYYAKGLQQAAERLSGKSQLSPSDGMTLIETLLGAIPAEGYPEPEETGTTVLDLLTAMSQGAGERTVSAQPAPQPSQAGGLLDALVSLAGGQESADLPDARARQPTDPLAGLLDALTGAGAPNQSQTPETTSAQSEGFDMGDVIDRLLPAGLAYLQARQEGADGVEAGQAALMRALLGKQTPHPRTSREAAGTVIAQSMLKALLRRRA
ncbi:MAG: hypothetical protein ACP5JG_15325 [Anaerolineae bacterium]